MKNEKKKNYSKPAMKTVMLKHRANLLQDSIYRDQVSMMDSSNFDKA
ncbi:MAG: hypothetical protein IKR75_08205 [Fibrobacter sp.]|jgi:hypothetical protein|nr:hypothetical protein [uncultured Fibrobacter sp.]MBR6318387.1 hypothetical protein [Fibrobacter sp.]